MRSSLLISAAISAVVASSGPATLAQTAPAQAPAPTVAPANQGASVGVMIFPFHMINNGTDAAWVSQAIDEDLHSDLAKNRSVSLIAPPTVMPANASEALQMGLRGGAQFVVYGTYQVADDGLRVTGSVIDVPDGKIVEPLSATGTLKQLFQMEDLLSQQVAEVLPAAQAQVSEVAPYVAPSVDQTATAAVAAYPTAPATTYYYPATPDYSDYAPAYYPAPYYGGYYPYGYGYGGIVIGGSFGFGRGFGGGFHGRGFGGGVGFHGGGFGGSRGFVGGGGGFHGGGGGRR